MRFNLQNLSRIAAVRLRGEAAQALASEQPRGALNHNSNNRTTSSSGNSSAMVSALTVEIPPAACNPWGENTRAANQMSARRSAALSPEQK